jgi:3-deoxy-D-manno-octulosonate 8-phosphate phosphatase (KDO 8-P phosphatase)
MENTPARTAALGQIRALALDVDGVLTDGSVWWGPNGEEWKCFHFADIMGLSLARRAGLSLALISGEDSALVDRLAAKLSIPFVVKGTRDKASALRAFAAFADIPVAEICFMGDDVNDLSAMRIAGLAAAPAGAATDVLAFVAFITRQRGGQGAVRELVEALLQARGTRAEDVYLRS